MHEQQGKRICKNSRGKGYAQTQDSHNIGLKLPPALSGVEGFETSSEIAKEVQAPNPCGSRKGMDGVQNGELVLSQAPRSTGGHSSITTESKRLLINCIVDYAVADTMHRGTVLTWGH